jgi:penicillin-insensitive murein DD-endopeptidase
VTECYKLAFMAHLGLSTWGCFGSPTPLAPGLHGSVGLPQQGTLTQAVELPREGVGYARYRPHSPRYFGTSELVAALVRSAEKVTRAFPRTPPVLIGDLSARHGGFISGHSSHRSGRDVDLLYYSTTLDGVPLRTPGFVHFGADGLARTPSGGFIRLDTERQWALLAALLLDPEIQVLWMFVSRDVEALIVNEALARDEPLELIHRAQQVLHQPRDSANHDDHVHLRIACSLEASIHGCSNGGPAWPWLPRPNLTSPDVALDEATVARGVPLTQDASAL